MLHLTVRPIRFTAFKSFNMTVYHLENIYFFIRFQICPNGLLCFGSPYSGFNVPRNNDYDFYFVGKYCLAPYFTDLDPRLYGRIYYNTYDFSKTASAEQSKVYVNVTNLVKAKYNVSAYSPGIVVKVTWEGVPPYPGLYTSAEVKSNFVIRDFKTQILHQNMFLCLTSFINQT